jgi:flagellar basal-body rod modification protein FlgD
MSTPPITAIPGLPVPGAPAQPAELRIPTKLLDQNDFLKLVVAQMTHQDPLKPTSDTEFLSQMTQFTALEQTKTMQKDISQMRVQQNILQAMSLLDREVVVQSNTAGVVTGVVKGFDLDSQEPKLLVGNGKYDLADILTIRMAAQNQEISN